MPTNIDNNLTAEQRLSISLGGLARDMGWRAFDLVALGTAESCQHAAELEGAATMVRTCAGA